ncbi:isocitrate lyase/PEP mutase family protein [Sinomicrobium weinanense]|uniref:Isocitrate lyase/phosphoenolpyruvate mutase family protein n=1 Tax=Sinomicrobium weinanense TaxID=2842200 RepID=A0A926Q1F1_9FLAO|nr:isocitrate lyase/phosphoenolpyruvate mutase family protein [Sinomicrobium weinanense]MBC9795712.1 isocitrate lyase/phosphoenolpyruvate mutase family protein [Sinomicrobium weinanense]MBU3125275.1 isocitrate lyase/phosphoenolpyruvate mutase family protein [Sinomicrobium weinanense]
MDLFEKFNQLHRSDLPLLLGNIWDVSSAKMFESRGFQALGTSSQAVAIANGYQDGEQLPFEILSSLARRVVESVQIPLTVDMEAGYADTVNKIIKNIQNLADIGVVGINIEDTVPGPDRKFQTIEAFSEKLSAIAEYISSNNLKIFLNVRTDGFLLNVPNALEETINRIQHYENAGASGIFTPCITSIPDIEAVVKATSLPINVMCMPGLPGFDILHRLGVKRISMGGFLFNRLQEDATRTVDQILGKQDFNPLFTGIFQD